MTVFRLDHRLVFPPAELADESGLLAVGGDLSAERLRLAYREGIFPWFDEDMPILWHSPNPRMVLLPSELHVSKSLRKAIRQAPYRITLDVAFRGVIETCGEISRPGQAGTWITAEMIEAYDELHRQGYAHSVEAWRGEDLVGGVYGVSLGSAFFGESMFALAPDASKIAFATLVQQLQRWEFDLIDCQMHTEHLERFGAREIARQEFMQRLARSVDRPTRLGPWRFGTD